VLKSAAPQCIEIVGYQVIIKRVHTVGMYAVLDCVLKEMVAFLTNIAMYTVET
jgi:hypothetical protein